MIPITGDIENAENPYIAYERKLDEAFERYDNADCAKLGEIVSLCSAELSDNLVNVKRLMPKILDVYTKVLIKLLLRDGKVHIKNLGTFSLYRRKTRITKNAHRAISPGVFETIDGYSFVGPSISIKFTPSTTVKHSIEKIFKTDDDICPNRRKYAKTFKKIGENWKFDEKHSWYIKMSRLLDVKYNSGDTLMWILHHGGTNLLKPTVKRYTHRQFVAARIKYFNKKFEENGIEQFKIGDTNDK